MKSKITKDRYNRVFFIKEIELIIKDYTKLPKQVQSNSIFQKKIFISKLKNRCIFSNKSRSVFVKYRLSRIFFRDFALLGKLTNVKKQSW